MEGTEAEFDQYLGSSQAFVRVLKGSADPPQVNGPSKLAIARACWARKDLVIPMKGELIAEWALTDMLKDRTPSPLTSAVVQPGQWELMADIIFDKHGSAINDWLRSFIARTSLYQIFTSYFTLLPQVDERTRTLLEVSFSNCFQTLWPIVSHRASVDNLLECFGSTFATLADHTQVITDVTHDVVRQICMAYQKHLPAASNRKKVAAAFQSSHWDLWMKSIRVLDRTRPTLNIVYLAGVETIFHSEVVKSTSEGNLDSLFTKTLAAWAASSPNLYHWAAPRLLDSFIIISGRTRNVGSSSTLKSNNHSNQGRSAILHLFLILDDLLGTQNGSFEAWNARTDMLHCLRSNKALSMRDSFLTSRLAHHAVAIMDLLGTSDLPGALQNPLLNCLHAISSMDIEVIIIHTPRILDTLLSCDVYLAQSESVLDELLDYYGKTRNIPTYMLHLLDSVRSIAGRVPDDLYRVACRSALFSVQHCEHVQQAVTTFITSAQTMDYADLVIDRLQNQLSDLVTSTNQHAPSEPRSGKVRKKRKLDLGQSSEGNAIATKCALTARIVSIALRSLPIQLLDTVAQTQTQQTLTEKVRQLTETALKSMIEVFGTPSHAQRPWTIAGAEIVRLHYTLCSSWKHWPHHINSVETQNLFGRLVLSEGLPPGLLLLLYRTNLVVIDSGPEVSHILQQLLKVFTRIHQMASTWSGEFDEMYIPGAGESVGAAALLQLVLGRCIRVAQLAQANHIHDSLARVLLSSICTPPSTDDSKGVVSTRDIVLAALHRAELWEASTMCDSLLKEAERRTNILDDLEHVWRLEAEAGDNLPITQTVHIFEFLLVAPPEILNHAFRSKMVLRALRLDSYISNEHESPDIHSLITVRSFIAKACDSLTALDSSAMTLMIAHMFRALSVHSHQHPHLVAISTFILKHILLVCMRTQGQSIMITSQMQNLLKLMSKKDCPQAPQGVIIVATCVLEAGIAAGKFQTDTDMQIRTTIDTVCHQLMTTCSASIFPILANNSKSSTVRIFVKAYQVSLRFRRTHSMGITDQLPTPELLTSLVSSSVTAGTNGDVTFSLLVEFWRSAGTEDANTFETVLTAYFKLSKRSTPGSSSLAKLWQETVHILSVNTWRQALTLLHEFIKQRDLNIDDLALAMSIADQTLQHAPDGSTKTAQAVINQYLLTFINHGWIWSNQPATRIAALNCLLNYCSARPASLRPVDVNNTILYLSQIMAPSSSHDTRTATAVFHGVSTILSSLIHARRDLVSHVLPHVGLLLGRLVFCFRRSRSQLGEGQSRKIYDVFPSWLAPNNPLGVNEARALSRLLGLFAVKTTVRTFTPQGNGAEGATASLARAFGKHTMTVLKAYVDALNDPLSTVPADVRKELQPGMFAMCGMISEHSRDALMVSSLDSSGKYLMKALWKDYEKQRYIGKG